MDVLGSRDVMGSGFPAFSLPGFVCQHPCWGAAAPGVSCAPSAPVLLELLQAEEDLCLHIEQHRSAWIKLQLSIFWEGGLRLSPPHPPLPSPNLSRCSCPADSPVHGWGCVVLLPSPRPTALRLHFPQQPMGWGFTCT